jgi:hypothetical protein
VGQRLAWRALPVGVRLKPPRRRLCCDEGGRLPDQSQLVFPLLRQQATNAWGDVQILRSPSPGGRLMAPETCHSAFYVTDGGADGVDVAQPIRSTLELTMSEPSRATSARRPNLYGRDLAPDPSQPAPAVRPSLRVALWACLLSSLAWRPSFCRNAEPALPHRLRAGSALHSRNL